MRKESDCKIVLIPVVPMFGAAMWYGISHGYENMWLFAVVIALASLGIAGRSVAVVRKWQEWRGQSWGGRDN